VIPYFGELLALASPVTWSFAVILFRKTGERVPAVAFNLFKMGVALALVLATWGVTVLVTPPESRAHPDDLRTILILLGSGVTGIGIADTLFLMSLNRIGAGLSAIVTTSYSPSIIGLSVLFLGERLTVVQAVGVVAILSAVLLVTSMRGPHGELDRRTLATGAVLGVSAMVSQAVSVVMVKTLLENSPIVWANSWRLAGGIASVVVLLPVLPREHREGLGTLRDRRNWPWMAGSAVLGNYVSLLLWLGGMKYTKASIAAALNQTATLWTFVLAAILLREPITWLRILGLSIGLLGVALVTFG
jgi:drug/metabolite transporter (DMT)-like permease